MISFFNKIGNTWIAKAIFAVLGISMMAFWGIGGIGNTSGSDTTAIQVGKRKISMNELNKVFDTERAKISQIAGQYISPKQALQMGLLEQSIQKTLTDAINEAIQDDLGLTASDAAVRKYVERHPVFKDSLGNFDRNLFSAYLSQTRLTEAQLAEQLRDELANQHLSNTIRFAAPTSKALAEMKWYHQNQQRDVEALMIETNKIVVPSQPTEEDLKDYYEAYLSEYMIPETRDLDILLLTPAQIGKNIQISQSELDEAYEAQKANFEIPERRHVYQIRFNNEESAKAARKDITAANFMSKATEFGQTESNTDFGPVTRNELLPEIADTAFKAQANTVVGPVETDMGWHILLVKEIQPAVKPDKAKVYAEIKEKMVAEIAYDRMTETTRKLEDLLGEGLTLKEAATKLGLATQTFNNVEMTATTLPENLRNTELMQDVFTLKENETTALMEQANGYIVAEVKKITPVQAKNFADVRANLRELWVKEQQKAMLPEVIKNATEQMKNGSIPAKLGHIMIVNQASLSEPKELPIPSLTNVFTQGLGYENATATTLPEGAIITVVKKTRTPLMKNDVLPDQMEQLSADNAELMYQGVVASYADNMNIVINTNAIQKAFSVYQTE